MAPPRFALYLIYLFLGTIAQMTDVESSIYVRQYSGFYSADVGDSVTLQCFYEGLAVMFNWYKQTLGQKPRLLSTFYKHDESGTFHNEFKNNTRYTLDTGNGKNHLTIIDLRFSDSATYYCTGYHSYDLEFVEGVILSVNGSGLKVPVLVHQSTSEPIQPGGSVTLNCTVQTGSCDGEHSVYWFKNSEESAPQMIYSSGNDVCKRTGSTCVYNLPMRNLSCDDAGTYFCVVTSCGRTMFGNGTRIDIHKTAVTKPPELSPTIIALMLSNIILGIVTLVLIWTICKIQRKDSTEAISESSEGNQTGAVTYEAVCLAPRSLPSKRVTVKYSEDSVVYSDIKDCQQNREFRLWKVSASGNLSPS
ncbi:uncharacterized protein LOC121962400 [Plectropomus leopardus]|uniref:uncharacterized protein LOC121962400 n=1 Tax=Plectropomus leopardus TaxID=160734 RepID=UPI001C4B5C19|nr:uncharacterized protein LOC121962400 [Plectropomus leopardus]